MHEWALTEAVLSAAEEIAKKEGLKQITEISVGIGELQQVEPDILEFAFSQLKKGKFRNARLHIKTVKARLNCRVCGHRWVFDREKVDENTSEAVHFVPEVIHAFIKCPKCGSPDFEIAEGRGIWLEKVKGVK
jgi:hydrogenase nickel incorporation protein HypA/HybF